MLPASVRGTCGPEVTHEPEASAWPNPFSTGAFRFSVDPGAALSSIRRLELLGELIHKQEAADVEEAPVLERYPVSPTIAVRSSGPGALGGAPRGPSFKSLPPVQQITLLRRWVRPRGSGSGP